MEIDELSDENKDKELDKLNEFADMIKIIQNRNYIVERLSDSDKKILLGKLPGGTILSNMGLRILDVLSADQFEEFNDQLKDDYEIFYNPIWRSDHSENHTTQMDGDEFIKYLEFNVYLEPPIFTMKINGIREKKNDDDLKPPKTIEEYANQLNLPPTELLAIDLETLVNDTLDRVERNPDDMFDTSIGNRRLMGELLIRNINVKLGDSISDYTDDLQNLIEDDDSDKDIKISTSFTTGVFIDNVNIAVPVNFTE